MSKKLLELKKWASENITLINLLPTNTGLKVTTRLIDVLEDEVDEKYYFSEEKTKKLVINLDSNKIIRVREATKQGYALAERGDSVNVSYPTSKTRRGRVGKQVAQTLQAGEVNQGVVMGDIRIRKLVPIETWRLQGFTDEQFYKAKESGVSNSQLYKQAGNAVSVPVVDAIVKCL
ncbi:DNA cytosine methyltransferase [Staphylococcus cohnii]|nr:DNA cytosine methyltransferase [Staphylococcus cohnii]